MRELASLERGAGKLWLKVHGKKRGRSPEKEPSSPTILPEVGTKLPEVGGERSWDLGRALLALCPEELHTSHSGIAAKGLRLTSPDVLGFDEQGNQKLIALSWVHKWCHKRTFWRFVF